MASVSSKAQRVPGQGAPSLTGEQEGGRLRGVCYSFFLLTALLRSTLSQGTCLHEGESIVKTPEGKWSRFGRNEGRHTVGGLKT